jgi:hypothetical protein
VDDHGWRLWGRGQADYTTRYPELEMLRDLPAGTLLDGELVTLSEGLSTCFMSGDTPCYARHGGYGKRRWQSACSGRLCRACGKPLGSWARAKRTTRRRWRWDTKGLWPSRWRRRIGRVDEDRRGEKSSLGLAAGDAVADEHGGHSHANVGNGGARIARIRSRKRPGP